MREPSRPLDGSSPRDGDVVVTRESRSGRHYTVRQLPGVIQIRTAGRDQAEQLARGFGQRYAIDVWYSDAAGTYRLLEAFRSETPARAAKDAGSALALDRRSAGGTTWREPR